MCWKMIEEQIVGKWKWNTITYDFRSDGTYEYFNTASGVRTNGRYAINDDIITFFIASAVTSKISIHGNELALTPLTPERGNRNIFTRVY